MSNLRWLFRREKAVFHNVGEGLQQVYQSKLLPAELSSNFHWFHSPELPSGYFTCKPMILTLGQYSTGKTTLIRHLLEKDYPGMHAGQEPTTDRFVAISQGSERIPGNALIYDKQFPFQPLGRFGNAFLSRFECAQVESRALEGVTFIDTPGVLSGEKQRIQRGYDFEEVMAWFADHADMILLTFDASKLDISDEFRRCIDATAKNVNKVNIILNKADQLPVQQLMRCYGALMWSLGRVFSSPEAVRVYVGSFWDQPLRNETFRDLFDREQHDLYDDINNLPRSSSLRKINDFARRARDVKAHLVLEGHIRSSKPWLTDYSKWRNEVIESLPSMYQKLSDVRRIPIGDFPTLDRMQLKLAEMDLEQFKGLKSLDERQLGVIDDLLSEDIPALLQLVPQDNKSIHDEVPEIASSK
eukprot:TRINITY_DN47801_c0_g1_i1.p1 TRINITY_DN47801_c0_g1~~TRINITY_DN47801_c0_g1_i1.p1  ORF type:complete len:414 (-),score=39.76 TRINITY_DN47801_c0_g1_i1:12-1253(-)